MGSVLHISDPHFGTERPVVAKALQRFAHAQQPSLVILSGDITQRARKAQFAAAHDYIDSLAIPSRLVLAGNHDIPLFDLVTRIFAPYSRYQSVFGPELEPTHESPELLVLGVRTTRRYRHIEGEVSARQIERVAQRLARADAGQLRIVVTHQPVFVTHEEDRKHLLRGHETAIEKWTQAGADLILGGHIHRPFICALPEHLTHVRSNMWVMQAGTAISTRIRSESGNSVNFIRLSEQGGSRDCALERWDYQDEVDEFVMVERHSNAPGQV